MVGCFVPRCVSGHRRGEKSHLFRPSPQMASEWITVMKKLRKDKDFDPKNDNHRICHHHFKEEDVLSNYSCVINGKLTTYPRGRWTLTAGAVPRIFNNLPASIQPAISKTRRSILRRSQNTVQKPKTRNKCTNEDEPSLTRSVNIQNPDLTESELLNWWNNLSSKDGWVIDSAVPQLYALHSFSYINNVPETKSIVVSALEYHLNVKIGNKALITIILYFFLDLILRSY